MSRAARLWSWLSERLGVKHPGQPLSETPGVLWPGQESAAGVRVTEETALSLSGVFAAVNLLSRIVGSLPLNVYRRRGDGGKDLALTHPAYRLLHTEANVEMTAVTARRVLDIHRLLWGNGYQEIHWDGGGNVRALWPVEPWRVKPKRNGADGSLYYLVDGVRKVAPADMIHVPLISFDGVAGRSWIDYALDSLGLGIASQEFAAKFFANGARPGGLLMNPGTPKKEARDEMRETWQKAHAGSRNSNKVGVLWGGWTFDRNAGSFSPQESQLIEERRFTVEETARWLNVPPHLLAELTRATFSNIEEQGLNFIVYSLGPVVTDYEQEYDRKLLKPPELFCKHNFGWLLRGNMAARSTFYRELFNIGVLSINDILELEDRNPIGKGGDAHFVPLNMQTVERALEPPKPPKPTPTPVRSDVPTPKLRAALAALVADTLERLARKEANELRRVKPDRLMAWAGEFYPAHERLLAEALQPAVEACRAAGFDADAAAIAADWAAASRDLLGRTGEPATVESSILTRPGAVAANLLGGAS